MAFRKDFAWGAATASYQIEGAAHEDGKGLSIWDVFCRKEGAIYKGHTGDIACDHYHRYKEDISIMKELGLKAYRFSISWSRIFPDGTGEINLKGVEFYDNLVNGLLDAGIEPYMTLYHWDLPYALHIKGGWRNPDICQAFSEYAGFIAKHFSDRVKYFITFNEPQVFIGNGNGSGKHAPGLKMQIEDTIPMSHNVLKAHGMAVKEMRKQAVNDILIGYAPTFSFGYPETESDADIKAAQKYSFKMPTDPSGWFWNVTWWSDPVIFGHYPEDGLNLYGKYLPKGWENDMEIIHQDIDFYAQNLYCGNMVRAAENENGYEKVEEYDGFAKNTLGWSITPEAIRWSSKFLYDRYKLPLYISENGISLNDVISLDGNVHDSSRIDFMHRYLLELKKATDDGVDLRGYFTWSLMDNFEWALGYSSRFGIVYIDYPTQKRIIKDSGYWYKDIIAANDIK